MSSKETDLKEKFRVALNSTAKVIADDFDVNMKNQENKKTKTKKSSSVVSGHKGLAKWFKQDWVDIGSKKKGGGFAKCGRSKQKKDAKRKYPKCVPRAKANRMTESQRKSAVSRKRSRAQGVGGKPTNVRTFAKRKKSATNKKR